MAPTICRIANSPVHVITGLLRNGKSSRGDGTGTCGSQRNPGSRPTPSRTGTVFHCELGRRLRANLTMTTSRRVVYYEYSAELAQENTNSKASEKGPRGNSRPRAFRAASGIGIISPPTADIDTDISNRAQSDSFRRPNLDGGILPGPWLKKFFGKIFCLNLLPTLIATKRRNLIHRSLCNRRAADVGSNPQ